jgi:hypothetical protein
MKRLHKLYLALGAFGVLALLALVTPRAAHAITAALVQVTNTPANPASVLDAGNPANEPFAWEALSHTTPVNAANFTTPSTTADGRTVQRLVIEEVSANCSGLSAATSGIRVSAYPSFSTAGASLGTVGNEVYVPFPINSVAGEQALSQQTRIYVDPGVTVYMNAIDFENSGVCAYTALGYFVVQ